MNQSPLDLACPYNTPGAAHSGQALNISARSIGSRTSIGPPLPTTCEVNLDQISI
jgi:hypothetical protein